MERCRNQPSVSGRREGDEMVKNRQESGGKEIKLGETYVAQVRDKLERLWTTVRMTESQSTRKKKWIGQNPADRQNQQRWTKPKIRDDFNSDGAFRPSFVQTLKSV